ncbi:hypothetical protein [Sphingomonas sp. KC8]|uniref:hypothetical protein n=1 Tax=Sphingomonas sp. KC8 TaxID=1030157 RepID=UPI000A31CDAC|nr:hypothetical protein [Sphingomonas sp. KC8]ARS25968.1 hypothetical protein KC8_01485 [Sphingomonas sp. KC8]
MKFRNLATTAAALSLLATPVTAAVLQEKFTPIEEVFYNGTAACVDFFAGLISQVKLAPTQPGPFDDHGFYNSDAATENPARVAMLGVGYRRHAYRAAVAGNQGQVYAVLSETPLLCRVGGFDSQSYRKSYAYYSTPANGWTRIETQSATPGVAMQRFSKSQGAMTIWINLSWTTAAAGPNSLTAMASVFVERSSPVAPNR